MAESAIGRKVLRPGIGIRAEDFLAASATEAGTGNDLLVLGLLVSVWCNYTTALVFLQ